MKREPDTSFKGALVDALYLVAISAFCFLALLLALLAASALKTLVVQ